MRIKMRQKIFGHSNVKHPITYGGHNYDNRCHLGHQHST